MDSMIATEETVVTPYVAAIEQEIRVASPPQCVDLVVELERLKTLVLARMMSMQAASATPCMPTGNGRYLTVEEMVIRFGVTDQWLYRHKKQMPHSQPSRKILLFPEQAITKWFTSNKRT